jgi:HlyD family secretion protein
MKRRVLVAIFGAAVIAVVIGALVWRSVSKAALLASPNGGARSAIVERGTMLVAVSASGSVDPQARVSLSFEVPGWVVEVPVMVGEPVKAGDVLARLDSTSLALQVQQAQAALASAKAQLAQLRAGPRPEEVAAAEANLRAAQAQVNAAAANLDQLEAGAGEAQIAAAEADVAAAMLQQKVAQISYDGTDKGNEDRKEQARYNLYAANEALAAAQARLDEARAGANADQVRGARANVSAAVAQRDGAQARLDLLRAGATAGQSAAAEAGVVQAQAARDLAQLSLEDGTLWAPFDGVVAEVNATAGELAPTGRPAIVLVDPSRFHIHVSVDEVDVGRLAEGQTAQVTLDALPDATIVGTVERIAPAAMVQGGVVDYEVIIALAPADAPIRTGMTANATIVTEELTDVLTIPTWVVRVDRSTGQTYVQRRAGTTLERVDVQVGVRYEGVAQVLGGLAEGDEVVWVPESQPFNMGSQ